VFEATQYQVVTDSLLNAMSLDIVIVAKIVMITDSLLDMRKDVSALLRVTQKGKLTRCSSSRRSGLNDQ